MIRSKWRTLLKGASTETEVIVLVRSFMGTWSADEIAAIPREAWPGHVVTPRDVMQAAMRLAAMHADYQGNEAGLALLQELLLFMTQAAVRVKHLGRLAATGSQPARLVATEPEEGIGGAVPSAPSDAPIPDDHG